MTDFIEILHRAVRAQKNAAELSKAKKGSSEYEARQKLFSAVDQAIVEILRDHLNKVQVKLDRSQNWSDRWAVLLIETGSITLRIPVCKLIELDRETSQKVRKKMNTNSNFEKMNQITRDLFQVRNFEAIGRLVAGADPSGGLNHYKEDLRRNYHAARHELVVLIPELAVKELFVLASSISTSYSYFVNIRGWFGNQVREATAYRMIELLAEPLPEEINSEFGITGCIFVKQLVGSDLDSIIAGKAQPHPSWIPGLQKLKAMSGGSKIYPVWVD